MSCHVTSCTIVFMGAQFKKLLAVEKDLWKVSESPQKLCNAFKSHELRDKKKLSAFFCMCETNCEAECIFLPKKKSPRVNS